MLNIVTPVGRTTFLKPIYESIKSSLTCDWKWYCVVDKECSDIKLELFGPNCEILYNSNNPGFYDGGSSCRNLALENIQHGWVYFLDDDTIFHPNLQYIVNNVEKYYPYAVGFTIIQLHADFTPRVVPHQKMRYDMDTGSYVFKREVIGDMRWRIGWVLNDVHFYNQIADKYELDIVHMTDVGGIYNFMRPAFESLSRNICKV